MKALNGSIMLAALIIITTGACHHSPAPTPTHTPVTTSTQPVVPAPPIPSPTTIHTAHSTPTPTVKPVVTPAHTTALCKYRYQYGEQLPDPKCTPGSIQSSDKAAICTPGWAAAHRMYFTKSERTAAFAKYGVHTLNPASYGEYDHLIPLELGGSNNPDNLWPEKGKIPNPKDTIENVLHSAVCSGKLSLATAQQEIAKNWATVPDTFQAS